MTLKIWSTVVGELKGLREKPGTRDLSNCRKHQALRLEEQWEEAVFSEPRSLERPCRGARAQPLMGLLRGLMRPVPKVPRKKARAWN